MLMNKKNRTFIKKELLIIGWVIYVVLGININLSSYKSIALWGFILLPLIVVGIDFLKKKMQNANFYISKIQLFSVPLIFFAIILMLFSVCQKYSIFTYLGRIRFIGIGLLFDTAVIVLYLIIILKAKLEKIFLILCSSLSIFMMYFLPVRMVPDEAAHIYTAYQKSEILLGNINSNDKLVPMRITDKEQFIDPIETQYTSKMIEKYYETMNEVPNVDYGDGYSNQLVLKNNDIAYFLPSLGITVGKILNLNGFYTLLLGRLFNLILYVMLCYWGVKLMPFNKLIPGFIALLPMALQQGMSYSYDALIISSSIFVVCGSLNLFYEECFNRRNKVILSLIILLFSVPLILLKSHAYFMIGIFPLFLYFHKKYSLKKYVKPILICVIGAIFTYFIVAFVLKFMGIKEIVTEPANPIAWTGGEQGYTIQYFINHRFKFPVILIETLLNQFIFYLQTGTCSSLGWLTIVIPNYYVFAFVLLLLMASISEKNNNYKIDSTIKIFFFFTVVITSFGIILGLILSWTPLSSDVAMGMQGRYFLPIYVEIELILRNNKLKFSNDYSYHLLISELLVLILFFTSFMVRF